MKVGEKWDCAKCGKVVKEKCSAMDVIGFYVVNGLCPSCAKKDKEVSEILAEFKHLE